MDSLIIIIFYLFLEELERLVAMSTKRVYMIFQLNKNYINISIYWAKKITSLNIHTCLNNNEEEQHI